jgi:hypothetical protein
MRRGGLSIGCVLLLLLMRRLLLLLVTAVLLLVLMGRLDAKRGGVRVRRLRLLLLGRLLATWRCLAIRIFRSIANR